jgi:TolB protein
MVSPDRRTIAFSSERTGEMQLWAMDVDGSRQRQLLASSTFDFHPAWSHDGRRILFQRRSATSGFDLWVLDLATDVQSRLTTLPRNEVGGFFSPDDRWVVFGGNNGTSNDVWVVPAAGGTPVALTAGACIENSSPCVLALDAQPSWTPDGRILFLSDRTGGIGIWTMAADGTDARLVIDLGDASAGMPYMSASGQRIVFVTNVHDVEGDRNVYTVRSDGRQLRRLTSAGDDLGPTFASGA